MKFWDASALVPLYIAQARTRACRALIKRDPDAVLWWGSRLECVSAFCRLQREEALSANELDQAIRALETDIEGWREVQPSEALRREAVRLLRVHALRSADAQQLAAAVIATDHVPSRLPFVCEDRRLIEAAQKEGFTIIR